MARKLTHEQFLTKVADNSDFSFDISRVSYINSRTPIQLKSTKCNHGWFWATPSNVLHRKTGCPSCAKNKPSSTSDFISKSRNIHGDMYLYDRSIYCASSEKIEIGCRKHGYFWQTPQEHLAGSSGCKKCTYALRAIKAKLTIDKFIAKARLVHSDRYQYDCVRYINSATKIDIRCVEHGLFSQRPRDHCRGHGCPTCACTSISSEGKCWLDSLDNINIIREYSIRMPSGDLIRVDGYDPTTNIVYEYNGVFWHGHPSKFDPDEFHPRGKTYGERYLDTLNREIRLKGLGYNVITKWN